MKYSLEFAGPVLVIVARGPWTSDRWTADFHNDVKNQIAAGIRNILVDLEHSSVSNSAGVGVLVAIRTSLLRVDGHIKLCNVPRKIMTSLTVAGIKSLFEIYGSRREALDAFEHAPV